MLPTPRTWTMAAGLAAPNSPAATTIALVQGRRHYQGTSSRSSTAQRRIGDFTGRDAEARLPAGARGDLRLDSAVLSVAAQRRRLRHRRLPQRAPQLRHPLRTQGVCRRRARASPQGADRARRQQPPTSIRVPARPRRARARGADFYVWTTPTGSSRRLRIIFTDTEKSNWTFDPVAGQFYYAPLSSRTSPTSITTTRRSSTR